VKLGKEIIKTNQLNEEELKNLIIKYSLAHPRSSLDFLITKYIFFLISRL